MARGQGDWEQLERRGAESELNADEILRLLIEAGVDFVVIGGFAVIAHGYLRATKDIDIVPRPTAENRDTLERALMSINARPIEQADLRPDEMPVQWGIGALSHGGNWALQTDHGRIDILQYIDRVDVVETYSELRDQAIEADVPDRAWHVIAQHCHAVRHGGRSAIRQGRLDQSHASRTGAEEDQPAPRQDARKGRRKRTGQPRPRGSDGRHRGNQWVCRLRSRCQKVDYEVGGLVDNMGGVHVPSRLDEEEPRVVDFLTGLVVELDRTRKSIDEA